MNTIDLRSIITGLELNPKEVAKELFPTNAHPKLALDRILKGEALLDSDQISRLAAFADVSIEDLYNFKGWKTKAVKDARKMVFTQGDYRAELDFATWTTQIFDNNSLKHEFILHGPAIGLEKYFAELNKQVEKIK